jgi:ABC-type cobalamin/Fe3+-siderophores transport system ATPase subunit
MSSIELCDLTVRFGRRAVVDGFSDTVRSGEWLGLIGPNGAGKSSLLRAVVGIVASTGQILVDGAPLSARSRARRAALIAFVPQAPELPDDMHVFEYVLLGRWTRSRLDGSPASAGASASASRSPGRSRPRHRSCCSTSRRARSTSAISSRRSSSWRACAATTASR